MKFADLNFAWADARAAVATDASVAKKATRTVSTVRMINDTVAAPAASVSLAAKAARRQQLAVLIPYQQGSLFRLIHYFVHTSPHAS